jgi:aldehyde:ferredoxin oxidoreductase
MNGYMSKTLRVDLSTQTLWDEPLNKSWAHAFVGGSGLAARYLWDIVDDHIDPLAPEAPLIWMTGPLVGTVTPSAGRCSVCALSPLTGIWGEANTGGFFGPELRFAGYDGIIVTGQAETPVWLSIIEGKANLHDAIHLWDKPATGGPDGGTYATQQRIREELGEPRARVACVGLAGENQVKMAAVMNDHGRAAGRTGLGAVMGSKNLKAVAVRGSAPVPVADDDGLQATVHEMLADLKGDFAALMLQMAGTAGYVDTALMYGDLPIRYFQQGEWANAAQLSGILMSEQFENRRRACYRCPIACGRETRAPRYGLPKVDGPEYETVGALGSLTMVDDLQAVIYAGHLCNVYGLDTISTGSTIALACEMYDRGVLNAANTGGLEIRYGDVDTIHRLIEMTAQRHGFGNILAEGSAALAEQFGVPELAVTVNRLEVPMHDPRAFAGLAVSYVLSPRGACHMQGDMYSVDIGQAPILELDIVPGDRFETTEAKGRMAARHQAWRNLYNALTLCQFHNPGVERLLDALNSVTGWSLGNTDLVTLGKRIVTLKRLLNLRLDPQHLDDRLPELLLKPLSDGGTQGKVPDLDSLLSGAYAEYGWDAQTGIPLPKTVEQLQLQSLCETP